MNRVDNILLEYDPTGTVNLREPAAVEAAISEILTRRYGSAYNQQLLRRSMADLVRCYRGQYPWLMRSDTLYHDLRHALETGLTMARLVDGDCESSGSGCSPMDAEQALLGIILALFHDVGLIRRVGETNAWGAEFLLVHETRSVQFVMTYLWSTPLIGFANKAELIMPTKLNFSIPDDWSAEDHKMASMIATADLLSQMADRCYLEKCRDFLFLEFCAVGLAGKPDSLYPDPLSLLRNTPNFVVGLAHNRLDREFHGVSHLVEAHFNGTDPYQDAISKHLHYLGRLLESDNLAGLRRRPQPYVDDVTV
jgi:hypothetical protein